MNRVPALLGILFLLAACDPATEPRPAETEPSVAFFSGVRVVPGDGSTPVEDAIFISDAGKITQLGKKGEFSPPGGSARIPLNDLTGTPIATVIPGLVNLEAYPGLANGPTFGTSNHNHENVTADLKRYEYYGVFAVASGGVSPGDLQYQIRDEQRQGNPGALLFTPGQGITAKGGYPVNTPGLESAALEVSTEADARKAVADLAAKKVDFIKLFVNGTPKLTPALYNAAIDESRKNNLKVVADAPLLADAKALVNAGVNGLVGSITDSAVDNALIAAMKDKNVFLAPALTSLESMFVYGDQPGWLNDQYLREGYEARFLGYVRHPVTVNRFRRMDTEPLQNRFNRAKQNLKLLSDAGVKIALGAGSGQAATFPGYFEHRELELMVDAGLSPADALKTSSVSAEFLGLADWGALKVGNVGNFLVLTENPLTDIKATRTAQQVYRNGSQVEQKALIEGITVNVPDITEADLEKDRELNKKRAEEIRVANLKKYGSWPLGSSVAARGQSIPTPLDSKAAVQLGPPDRITVTYSGSAAQWRAFYTAALAERSWSIAGPCWERKNLVTNKVSSLCIEPGGSSTLVTITDK